MQINLISFNIRCADDADGNSIKERAPRLFEITSLYDADIIAFQECTPKWKSLIKEYYCDKYDIFNKYRTRLIKRESCPILWKRDRFTLCDKGYFWLSDTPDVQSKGWDEKYDCFRICEYVILKENKNGNVFTAMNTHFGFGDSGQIKSAELIYNYSKKISSYPTFLSGDFNLTPDDAAYKTLIQYFNDSNLSKDYSPTYHGYNKNKSSGKHIDYIFADDRVVSMEYRVITELSDGMFPSDHYGLYTELTL